MGARVRPALQRRLSADPGRQAPALDGPAARANAGRRSGTSSDRWSRRRSAASPATWSDDLALLINRKGFLEETHFKVAYSPVPDDTVAGDRHRRRARDGRRDDRAGLSASASCARCASWARAPPTPRRPSEACASAAATLRGQHARRPVRALLSAGRRRHARRAWPAACGFEDGEQRRAPPRSIGADAPATGRSHGSLDASARRRCCDDLAERLGGAALRRAGREPPHTAIALPLASPEQPRAYGVLVCRRQPAPRARRRLPRLLRAGRRAGRHRDPQRARLRGRAAARRGAGRARPRQDGVLQQRQPRVPHAADADAGADRGRARVAAARCAGEALRHRPPQRAAPAEAGQHAARLLAHRGGPRAGVVTSRPTSRALTGDLASAFRSAIERGGLALRGRLSAAARAGLRRSRHVGEDRPQPAVERVQVHVRGSDRGRAARASASASSWRCATPAPASPRTSCRASSSASTACDGARARTHEGSGIGLALVQELVRLHGGDDPRRAARSARARRSRCRSRSARRTCPPSASAARRAASSARGAPSRSSQEALRWLPDARGCAQRPTRGGAGRRERGRRPRARRRRQRRHARLRARACSARAGHVEAVARRQRGAGARRARDAARSGPHRRDDAGARRLRAAARAAGGRAHGARSRSSCSRRARARRRRRGARGRRRRLPGQAVLRARAGGARRDRSSSMRAQRRARAEERAAPPRRRRSRAKDEFLAMLGHELRNPLAPILTALQLCGCAAATVVERERDDHRAPGRSPGAPGRRSARRLAHHARQDRAAAATGRAGGGRRKAIEMASPLLEQRAHHLDVDVPTPGCMVDGDRDAAGAGGLEPADQRGEVHRAGGTISRHRRSATATRSSLARARQRHRHRAEMLPRVFDLFVQERQALDRARGRPRPRAQRSCAASSSCTAARSRRTARARARAASSSCGCRRGARRAPPSARDARGRRERAAAPRTAGASSSSTTTRTPPRSRRGAVERSATHVEVAHDGPQALARLATLHARRRPARHRAAGDGRLRAGAPPPRRAAAAAAIRLIAITGYGQESDRAARAGGRLRRPPGQAGRPAGDRARDRRRAELVDHRAMLVAVKAAALLSTLLAVVPGRPRRRRRRPSWASSRSSGRRSGCRRRAGAVIGTTSCGCLQGAATLPASGPGYEAMHLGRNRRFGHPTLIAYVNGWGRREEGEARVDRRRRSVAAAWRPDAQRTPQPPDRAGRGHRLRGAGGPHETRVGCGERRNYRLQNISALANSLVAARVGYGGPASLQANRAFSEGGQF